MANENISNVITKALQTTFGRSDRQVDILKGLTEPLDKLGSVESIDQRLAKMFVGYTDLQYDRISRYRDYDRMDLQSTECQTGLDIYAEEASQKDTKSGYRVWVESEADPAIAAELNGMFQRIRLESKAYGIYRNIAKYGDCFIYLLLGGYGIHDTQFIHPSRVERVQEDGLLGYKSQELANLVPLDNRLGLFKPWDFLHFRNMAFDQENVYGRSFLEPLRKAWKQLNMLETLIVIYRLSKAVQRNIFIVDVGHSSVQETQTLVKEYEKFLKNKVQFVDPKTNDFKLDFNPATLMQDIVWPTRPGSNSKVEKLENTANIGPLEDLEYWKNKIRIGLNIPKDYFDGEYTGAWNSREALILQEIRFSRKITKLQDAFREGIVKMCQIHWAITHGEFLAPERFQVRLGTISDTADRQKEDVLLRKAQILEILGNLSVTMGWNRRVWTNYLLDQVYPLPAELRNKLNTPDPIDIEQVGKEVALNQLAGRQIRQHGKAKPPRKVTADSLKKGLRSFGEDEELPTADEILTLVESEFKDDPEIIEAVKVEINNSMPKIEMAETAFYCLTEEEITPVIAASSAIKERLTNKKVVSETKWSKAVKWQELRESALPPGILKSGANYNEDTGYKPVHLNRAYDKIEE